MKMSPRVLLSCAVTVVLLCVSGVSQNTRQNWVATWTTANVSGDEAPGYSSRTLREIVHTTIGGSAVRLRLANTFGSRPLRLEGVSIGVQKDGAGLLPGSNRTVTFGGSRSISIPEGAEVLSDAVTMPVKSQQNLAISLFVTSQNGPATVHEGAFQTNYISERGDFTTDDIGKAFSKTIDSWYFLGALDVLATPDVKGAIVALGDSITDGAGTHPDKYERWTDVLARRLLENHYGLSVLNTGIGGNRVLTSSPCWGANALARLGHDVLSQAGVRVIVLFEGTNDLGQPDSPASVTTPCITRTQVTAEDLIAAYKQVIVRGHARGLKVIGATILPYQGFEAWTPSGEAKRVAVNQWIRTSKAFDGVIDFDAALHDPRNPARMAAAYDSGDHLHPGPAGHEAMGKAIDLGLFR